MRKWQYALLAFAVFSTLLGSGIQIAYAQSGFFDSEIPNLTGTSKYRVHYSVPDIILTNTTEKANLTFEVLQLGGLAQAVKSQSVEMQLSANSKSLKWTISQEVRVFNAAGIWGPFVYDFKSLDSDFGLAPKQEVSGYMSVTVTFLEIAFPFSTEHTHSITKTDIAVELMSTTEPTTIDFVTQLVGIFGFAPVPLLAVAVAVAISITVTVSVKIRRTVRF